MEHNQSGNAVGPALLEVETIERPPSGNSHISLQPAVNFEPLRGHKVVIMCPYCKTKMRTNVEYEIGKCSWLTCVILVFIGCDLGCCFIPFCTHAFMDSIHKCSKCDKTLGKWNRLMTCCNSKPADTDTE